MQSLWRTGRGQLGDDLAADVFDLLDVPVVRQSKPAEKAIPRTTVIQLHHRPPPTLTRHPRAALRRRLAHPYAGGTVVVVLRPVWSWA